MAENLTKSALTIAIIALVTSLGIPISETLFVNELGDYYICQANNEIFEAKGGISGTGLSAYPFEDSRKSANRCKYEDGTNSKWVKLSDYAKELGLDPYDLIQEKEVEEIEVNEVKEIVLEPQRQINNKILKEKCGFDGCIPIN